LAEPMPLQRIVRPAPVMLLNSRPRTFVLFVGEKPFPYIAELVEVDENSEAIYALILMRSVDGDAELCSHC
jgi:hypothetical protein